MRIDLLNRLIKKYAKIFLENIIEDFGNAHQEKSKNIIYNSIRDLSDIIQLHAGLGMSEMEVYVDKKNCYKYAESFRKKGFYCRVIEFKSLKNECRLYISWISDI
jgi:hypothetical protein